MDIAKSLAFSILKRHPHFVLPTFRSAFSSSEAAVTELWRFVVLVHGGSLSSLSAGECVVVLLPHLSPNAAPFCHDWRLILAPTSAPLLNHHTRRKRPESARFYTTHAVTTGSAAWLNFWLFTFNVWNEATVRSLVVILRTRGLAVCNKTTAAEVRRWRMEALMWRSRGWQNVRFKNLFNFFSLRYLSVFVKCFTNHRIKHFQSLSLCSAWFCKCFARVAAHANDPGMKFDALRSQECWLEG